MRFGWNRLIGFALTVVLTAWWSHYFDYHRNIRQEMGGWKAIILVLAAAVLFGLYVSPLHKLPHRVVATAFLLVGALLVVVAINTFGDLTGRGVKYLFALLVCALVTTWLVVFDGGSARTSRARIPGNSRWSRIPRPSFSFRRP